MTLRTSPKTLELATNSAFMKDRFEPRFSARFATSAPIADFRVQRVMPRKSGGVLIQYTVGRATMENSTDHETYYGEWYPDSSLPELPEANQAGVENFQDLGLRLWWFPNDPKLRKIRSLTDATQFSNTYDDSLEASGITPPAGEQETDILGYRLGRRFVMRISWPEKDMPTNAAPTQLVAKMCRPKQALALWTRHRQLEHESLARVASHDIFLPRQLLIEKRSGVIFQTAEQGPSLHDLINERSFVDGCRAAIVSLKALQACRMTGLPRYTISDELMYLNWLMHETCSVFPDVAGVLSTLMTNLQQRVPEESATPVVCHRDFYDKQVLYNGQRVVLIDFDTLAEADAALDVGNFIAHLQWRANQLPSASKNLSDAELAVRDTIGNHDLKYAERVEWWSAAARARLACIYLWRPQWREQALGFVGDLLSREQPHVSTH